MIPSAVFQYQIAQFPNSEMNRERGESLMMLYRCPYAIMMPEHDIRISIYCWILFIIFISRKATISSHLSHASNGSGSGEADYETKKVYSIPCDSIVEIIWASAATRMTAHNATIRLRFATCHRFESVGISNSWPGDVFILLSQTINSVIDFLLFSLPLMALADSTISNLVTINGLRWLDDRFDSNLNGTYGRMRAARLFFSRQFIYMRGALSLSLRCVS